MCYKWTWSMWNATQITTISDVLLTFLSDSSGKIFAYKSYEDMCVCWRIWLIYKTSTGSFSNIFSKIDIRRSKWPDEGLPSFVIKYEEKLAIRHAVNRLIKQQNRINSSIIISMFYNEAKILFFLPLTTNYHIPRYYKTCINFHVNYL